jgi:type I restriction enzyme S subunit
MEKQNDSSTYRSGSLPKLRFPDFSDNWNTKKMGDIAKFSKGKGISKSEISVDGTTQCIRYGELYTRYGEVINEVYSKTDVDLKNLVLSEANDVIIPASGETQIDIATASCVMKSGIALGGDLNIIKTENNGVFLSYYLNNRKKTEIANLAQGISVVHLYSSQLATLNLNLPTLLEQTRIASFFSVVDQKLAQLKQKKSLLEQYKKGVMQKLFSQEMHFKDENGKEFPKWEKKKLGEVLTIGSGRDYKHLGLGEIPVFGTGGYMTSVNDFLYDGETVCIGRKGTINSPMFYKGKIWTVDTLFYTHSFKNSIPKFVYYVFQTINWKEHNEASGVPSLSKSTIEKILMPIPCLPEQTKIGNFLSTLDEKIERTQNQIQQTEQYKKGLLQKMFC